MNLKNLEYIEKNNPVIKEEIDFAEKRINGELPKVYKEFLRYANGINPNSKEDMKLLREVLRNNYFDDEDE